VRTIGINIMLAGLGRATFKGGLCVGRIRVAGSAEH
jgi:hypothetical protein